ncbi:class I SAM-dependent methyltransferase [Litorimonas sp. RW-G-Af-16]|uniref:N5-glutamine methyltransferase family protein n=1 Tax=Litorimonas sp. RW-G-Af-16 TaxID=3241168 RepID=UPI003AAF9F1D
MVTPLDQRPRSGPYSGINARSAKRFLAEQFRQADLPFPEEDARDLVLAATGLSEVELITRGTEFLTPEAFERVSEFAARRMSGEPVDHILGERFFYDLPFTVTRNVLSPRADTEVLVRESLRLLEGIASPHILDLGTGSGAVLISLLHARPDANGVGVDLSDAALAVAKSNAARHDIAAEWICGSWYDPIDKARRFDVIVSNPLYF